MNLIFDIGGVVVEWEPERIVERFHPDKEIQLKILNEILRHSDWLEYDKGTLTLKETASRGTLRTGLDINLVERFMRSVPANLLLKPETVDLMQHLKASGKKLYCLSNMNFESLAFLQKQYDFLELFDGKVLSCLINMVKPDPAIFEYILATYNLNLAETIFIDDSKFNIEATRKLGLKSILFIDIQQCKKELRLLGAL
jgi:putative hydrolase of the HAD superfamily